MQNLQNTLEQLFAALNDANKILDDQEFYEKVVFWDFVTNNYEGTPVYQEINVVCPFGMTDGSEALARLSYPNCVKEKPENSGSTPNIKFIKMLGDKAITGAEVIDKIDKIHSLVCSICQTTAELKKLYKECNAASHSGKMFMQDEIIIKISGDGSLVTLGSLTD